TPSKAQTMARGRRGATPPTGRFRLITRPTPGPHIISTCIYYTHDTNLVFASFPPPSFPAAARATMPVEAAGCDAGAFCRSDGSLVRPGRLRRVLRHACGGFGYARADHPKPAKGELQ